MTSIAVDLPPEGAAARARVVVAIGQARVASAVEQLLRAEGTYDIDASGRTASSGDATLAILDAAFLVRSSGRIDVPAIVLLRNDVEREVATQRVGDVRRWLPTSSTGDELLAAVDAVIRALPPRGSVATEVPVAGVAPVPTGPTVMKTEPVATRLGLVHEGALATLSLILCSAIVAVLWAALA